MQQNSHGDLSRANDYSSRSYYKTARKDGELFCQRWVLFPKHQKHHSPSSRYRHDRIEDTSTVDQRQFAQFAHHLHEKNNAVFQRIMVNGSSQRETNELTNDYDKRFFSE